MLHNSAMRQVISKRRIPDKSIIKWTPLVARGQWVDIYTDIDSYEADKLAHMADCSYQHIQKKFSLKYNHDLLGERIKIYCSNAVKVSHVYGGYLQPEQPLGKIFLNLRSALGAIQGNNATYIHEMAHLFAWNFHSHSLREGLADYIASKLHNSSVSIGPVPADFILAEGDLKRYSRYWATVKNPPRKLKTDIEFRRAYYFSCRLFVTYLIQSFGFGKFMSLYDSPQPEIDLEHIYKKKRCELVAQFIATTN